MKKFTCAIVMILALAFSAEAEVSCWKDYRYNWVREADKNKSFEEYMAMVAAHFAAQFVGCLEQDCAKVREQYDSIDDYLDSFWMKDDLFIKHYYDMEWYFEAELGDLDFRYWKRNNPSWKDGRNWREFRKEIGGCYDTAAT